MNMMDIGLVEILISIELRETSISKANTELDSAEYHLGNAMRFELFSVCISLVQSFYICISKQLRIFLVNLNMLCHLTFLDFQLAY